MCVDEREREREKERRREKNKARKKKRGSSKGAWAYIVTFPPTTVFFLDTWEQPCSRFIVLGC